MKWPLIPEETLKDARALTLLTRAASPEAVRMVAALSTQLGAAEANGGRSNRRRAIGLGKLQRATEALVGGLLLNASRAGAASWSWQTTQARTFSCEEVASRQFQAARKGLVSAGLIEERGSFTRFYHFDGGPPAVDRYATRFRQTPKLLGLAASYGIELSTAAGHFRRERSSEPMSPIVLSGLSSRVRGQKIAGAPIAIPNSPEAEAIALEVAEVNDFVRASSVEGCDPIVFRRHFVPDLSHGGRFFAVGGSYQTMKKAARSQLRLAGKPVVEVDVRASHFTLLRARLGLSPIDGDPYDLPKIPRELVKGWITACIGGGKLPSRWSRKVVEKHREAAKRWKVRDVQEAILARYPYFATVASALGCGDEPRLSSLKLMATEAAALTSAMRSMREQGKLALPLHDALIVAASDAEAAREAIRNAYRLHAGVTPTVS